MIPEHSTHQGAQPVGSVWLLTERAKRAAHKIADAAWNNVLDRDEGVAAVAIACGLTLSRIAPEWPFICTEARRLYKEKHSHD